MSVKSFDENYQYILLFGSISPVKYLTESIPTELQFVALSASSEIGKVSEEWVRFVLLIRKIPYLNFKGV